MELEIAVQALREEGFRVSIDSFNPDEVAMGLAAGAECILSVNSSNLNKVRDWQDRFGAFEVVVLPDSPKDLPTLYPLVEKLHKWNQRFRIDPILEPIGMGFAESLGRYLQVRQRYPEAEILMGIGNLTELTDVDSAGLNVMLAGFCQELGIRSVLTTEVINWSRSSVKEFDIARRLMHYAVKNKTVPKRIENQLVMLRDPKVHHLGEEGLRDLAERITDSNYRLFVEAGEIHVINGKMHLRGKDPFDIFEDMMKLDSKLDASHSFYLGYEMAKMVTAMTLNKNYTQDQALSWGFLTVPEISHR
jgi:dihydropteroate synthase-like protein